jgi:hypothetical protein
MQQTVAVSSLAVADSQARSGVSYVVLNHGENMKAQNLACLLHASLLPVTVAASRGSITTSHLVISLLHASSILASTLLMGMRLPFRAMVDRKVTPYLHRGI